MGKISIITITFNNFEELVDTIESLKVIESFKYEIIVINGGHCHKTKEYLEKNNHIISLSEPDKGISDAFNKGVKKATCNYLTFLNSGDFLLNEDHYKKSIIELDKDESLSLTFSSIIKGTETGERLLKPTHKPVGFGIPFPHQSAVYRASIFDEVGYFSLDYKIAMDFDHYLRMYNKDMKSKEILTKPSIKMIGGGISSTQERNAFKENYRALKENNQLTVINKIFYLYRYFKFFIKKLLLAPTKLLSSTNT